MPAANFVEYAYTGGGVSGSGNGVLSAYDPGHITRTYSNISGISHQVSKAYDGTNLTASGAAIFGSATITGASSAATPTGVTTNLSSPTFTYPQQNRGTSLTVTANATYTRNPTHSSHGTAYSLD